MSWFLYLTIPIVLITTYYILFLVFKTVKNIIVYFNHNINIMITNIYSMYYFYIRFVLINIILFYNFLHYIFNIFILEF